MTLSELHALLSHEIGGSSLFENSCGYPEYVLKVLPEGPILASFLAAPSLNVIVTPLTLHETVCSWY